MPKEYHRQYYRKHRTAKWNWRGAERKDTPKASIKPTQRDIGWAAGFIEGEGSIAVYRNGSSASCGVNATNCDLQPLRKLQVLFGGRISKMTMSSRNRQQPYRWAIYGCRARGIILTLYMLLSDRRKERCRAALKAVGA